MAGAVFLLANLGSSGMLWQDEAETAVLARNVLRFGYPRAFDGQSYIEITAIGYGPGNSWVYSPWLPFYLLAGAFSLLGESTWAARLPFALAGLASLGLAWRLALRVSSRLTARLTLALLTCSVPFLLHMRQCRYYSLTTALVLLCCHAYLSMRQRPTRGAVARLALALTALFHTNFGTFIPTAAAVGAHLWAAPVRMDRRWLALAAGAMLLLTAPWAVFAYRPGHLGHPSLHRAAAHLAYYIRVTNKYLVPLAFMLAAQAAAALLGRRRLRPGAVAPDWRRPAAWLASDAGFLGLLAAAHAAFLLVPDQRHMRYLIPALPVLFLGEAAWLAVWWRRARPAAAFITVLALFTTVLHSPHPRAPLADFLYELTHRYEGPMEGVVVYLRAHGKPGQLVRIPYDDRTLIFYTPLRVEGAPLFLEPGEPDWVVLRRDWLPPGFFASARYRHLEAAYDRIELDAPDIQWQNREDPGSHHFRSVEGAPRVVIYRKRDRTVHG